MILIVCFEQRATVSGHNETRQEARPTQRPSSQNWTVQTRSIFPEALSPRAPGPRFSLTPYLDPSCPWASWLAPLRSTASDFALPVRTHLILTGGDRYSRGGILAPHKWQKFAPSKAGLPHSTHSSKARVHSATFHIESRLHRKVNNLVKFNCITAALTRLPACSNANKEEIAGWWLLAKAFAPRTDLARSRVELGSRLNSPKKAGCRLVDCKRRIRPNRPEVVAH